MLKIRIALVIILLVIVTSTAVAQFGQPSDGEVVYPITQVYLPTVRSQ